ncbi:hypothetical protein [Kitasatospora phosalacinea]|uniref:hypothetical protein n=1 Tax=Kitasatospora phosalacinea TaxID=2065 RepID=UPI000525F12F|nr:hypothetical protein [Kitasatospora phosalacinea]
MPVRTARPHRRLDLTAPYDLHHYNYLRYAELLLRADDAFDALAEIRQHVLSTASPAACAWQAVRDHVRALADPARLRPTAHLEPPQQDALLLHTVLNLPLDVVADLTGAEAATTHVHLRALTARTDRPKPR